MKFEEKESIEDSTEVVVEPEVMEAVMVKKPNLC
jgi:hypothetical protein